MGQQEEGYFGFSVLCFKKLFLSVDKKLKNY